MATFTGYTHNSQRFVEVEYDTVNLFVDRSKCKLIDSCTVVAEVFPTLLTWYEKLALSA